MKFSLRFGDNYLKYKLITDQFDAWMRSAERRVSRRLTDAKAAIIMIMGMPRAVAMATLKSIVIGTSTGAVIAKDVPIRLTMANRARAIGASDARQAGVESSPA